MCIIITGSLLLVNDDVSTAQATQHHMRNVHCAVSVTNKHLSEVWGKLQKKKSTVTHNNSLAEI